MLGEECNVKGVSKDLVDQLAQEANVDHVITIIDRDAQDEFWMDIHELKLGEDEPNTVKLNSGVEVDISKITPKEEKKDIFKEENYEEKESFTIQVFTKDKPQVNHEFNKTETVQFDGIISEIVADLIKHGHVNLNSKLLIVTDNSLSKRYNISLLVVDVDKVLYRIGKFKLAEKMKSETIIETIIELAQEIGREGREGKKVGTLFVIGDPDELKSFTRQLIMNPFKGYEKDMLDIVNNKTLDETIKNFAQLDGAFIIDNNGHVISAGTYLDVDTSGVKPYAGWGTKHLAATAITNMTSSVAVLVSESGGAVKVFKNGKLILKLR